MKLVPVEDLIVGKSRRWLADACRAGRIPGSRKIGQTWLVDVDLFNAAMRGEEPPKVESADSAVEAQVRARFRCATPPTIEEAAEQLRLLERSRKRKPR